jgi:hypothetical protein
MEDSTSDKGISGLSLAPMAVSDTSVGRAKIGSEVKNTAVRQVVLISEPRARASFIEGLARIACLACL